MIPDGGDGDDECAWICMNGKLKSSRKIFAPFFPSPQSFDTVTLDDNYSHVEDGYKR